MIVLVGFMGAGKTTVGQLLAAKLGVPFTDSDHVIEDRAGKPIRRIFADEGEPAFRQQEHEVIASLLAGGDGDDGADGVLALGGGAVGHPGTRALLAGFPVVYLRVSYADAISRVGGDSTRPMLARPGGARLHADRDSLYAQVATLTVETGSRTPDDIALAILGGL
jgi:shikimate kinase